MSHVFHRSNVAKYPIAVKGEGVYIIDSEGKKYFDGCCGAAVSCLGHSNTEVIAAINNQLNNIPFAHSGFFTTEPLEQLADWLVERAPAGIEKVYFVSGGSEAIEASIKLARQYFLEIGKPQKKYVIARWQSYHGNTLGALAAGGNKWRRTQYEPLLIPMTHISPCYEYRGKREGESSYEFGQRVANELEAQILELGAENVMSFIAEPVVGATVGCAPAVEGYFKRIREICDKYDVLLILDEVMCGMGRTGTLFACEQDGITGDIITIAKGLGAGYQPIGAALVSGKIYDAITNGSGFFQHGHTYIGHATACAAALAVQKVIERDGLLENVKSKGKLLKDKLSEHFAGHPNVGDIRGRGLFVGVEFVEDKQTKAHFNNSLKINAKLKNVAMKEGLMCYAMGGTIDGQNGDHVMFAPPFIINDTQVAEIVDKFEKAVDAVFGAVSNQKIAV
ncbi:MAG: putative aminotransferase [Rickettsiaceae bacterium]|jgi:adenosylmethionine-8-amino-7-oxononanoate aminotransferase|nr:putative aminotransferase [Rickettsiaceae bacterium]